MRGLISGGKKRTTAFGATGGERRGGNCGGEHRGGRKKEDGKTRVYSMMPFKKGPEARLLRWLEKGLN